ncbi:MAG TPA: hypothetical protein VFV63_20430 [Ilumatobacteraceae bacterium]|nr:hypothetical protein [Ilumatobacteraceae bacterium]
MADDEALRDRLRGALTDAMKQRDRTAVTALRTALSAIDNSEAVARPEPPSAVGSGAIAGAVHGVGRSEAVRRHLTEGEILDVVIEQIDERDHAADEYERMGQLDRANLLRDEAAVLRSHVVP